jgi:phage gp46-like protein
MTDLYLKTADEGYYDIDIGSNGDFDLTEGLDTSIKMSISEQIRDESIDETSKRGGWWGNQVRSDLYELGSLIWTYYQSKESSETESNIQEAIISSLQWLIDDSIASRIEVDLVLAEGTVSATISVIKNESIVDSFFIQLFSNTRE